MLVFNAMEDITNDEYLARCWEIHATRADPTESLSSLHQVAKCLTMKLAVYLAKEVAAILRAVLTHDTKKLYDEGTVHLLCSNYWKGIDPAVAWPVLLHTNGSHLLLAPDFATGSVVFAMLIPCRCGFRPTGPLWYYNSYNTRRIAIELPTLLGWTRRKLRPILESSGRRQGPTGVCSSRSATIEMVTDKATFVC